VAARKAKIGDICEIPTPAGLAYVQYTHDGRGMGELVRVLPGLFSSRPADFSELAYKKELYFVYYTLNFALRAGQADIVANQQIPEPAKDYPMMRHPAAWDESGKTLTWKIIRASTPLTLENLRRLPTVHVLSPDQEKLPEDALWPHPVMVKNLARGWTPQRAEEFRLLDVGEAQTREATNPRDPIPGDQRLRHYLYFPSKPNAEKAAQALRARGLKVEVKRGADGETWLALATQGVPEGDGAIEKLREEMATLADSLRGEYDGCEVAL